MCVPRQTTQPVMPPCPAHPGERVDSGPNCCDLACVFGDRDQLWHGQEAGT